MTCGCGAGPVVEVIQHSPSFLIDAFTTSPFLTLLVAAPVLLALILVSIIGELERKSQSERQRGEKVELAK